MPSISPIDPTNTPPETQATLETVKRKMGGRVPNLVQTLALSPAALTGYLGFGTGVQQGALSPQLREQLALVVAQANGCDYCLAAHTGGAKMQGLSAEEILLNRQGQATDPRQAAALKFALAVVVHRGRVSDQDVQALRAEGYSDAEIIEITANVAFNILTNYINNVADTEVDFPAAPVLDSAAD